MNVPPLAARLHRSLNVLSTWLRSPLLLLIRLYWGWSFFQTGLGKLRNLERTTAFFASLHIPAPQLNAIAAATVECGGGLLLLLGLATRPICVPLTGVMLVAYATADNEALRAIFTDTDKFTSASPFLFLYAVVILFAFGPGRLSLDAVVFKDDTRV